jgi:hypothetical protein
MSTITRLRTSLNHHEVPLLLRVGSPLLKKVLGRSFCIVMDVIKTSETHTVFISVTVLQKVLIAGRCRLMRYRMVSFSSHCLKRKAESVNHRVAELQEEITATAQRVYVPFYSYRSH